MNILKHKRQGKKPDHTYLFKEVERFGGKQQVDVTVQALRETEFAMAKTVAESPDAFGATTDPDSQKEAVDRIMRHLSEQYLVKLTKNLRNKSGYIQVLGWWVHRSVITYSVYLLMAAIALTYFIPKILSPQAGAWWHGIIGLVLTIGVGIGILTRVRK